MELTYKWIAVSNRYYQMHLNRALAPYGISGSQYLFIIHICRCPGITQEALPELIQINKSNVTRALAQLEKHGFIRREPHPSDKRTATVFPTQKAQELYPVIMKTVEDWDAAITATLTPDEYLQLGATLRQLAEAAKNLVSPSR